MERYYRQNDASEHLLLQALAYDRAGDVYNAVKLYKRVIRMAPDWSAPFSFLSLIYKQRNEWQPSLHYSQKAVENNPFDEAAWRNLGIAATALKRWELAKKAWHQLGFKISKNKKKPALNPSPIIVRLNPNTKPEVVLAKRIDPARARIQSVPQPSSKHGFQDLILFDNNPNGYHYVGGKKFPVFDALEMIRPSVYFTFAVELLTDSIEDVLILEKLCHEANLGFDNWSNAYRMTKNAKENGGESYDISAFPATEKEQFLVAIGAEKDAEVLEILEAWKVISLKNFGRIQRF